MNLWLERDLEDGIHEHGGGEVTVTAKSAVWVHVHGTPRVLVVFEDGKTHLRVADPEGRVLYQIETAEEVEDE